MMYSADDSNTEVFYFKNATATFSSLLNNKEKNILDKVIVKFVDFKAKEIVDYMHQEKAYTQTRPGEIIPYSLAKQISAF